MALPTRSQQLGWLIVITLLIVLAWLRLRG
jgi:hypothetical protein